MNARPRRSKAGLPLVAGVVAVACLTLACAHKPAPLHSLRALVMDFENAIPGEQGAAFPQSLAEMMTASLANQPGVTVIDRQDVARLQVKAEDQANRWQYLGKKAGADYIVIGSIARLDQNYVINARLVSVETGQIVTGSSITRSCNRQEDIYPLVQYMADMMGVALQQLSGIHTAEQSAATQVQSQPSQAPAASGAASQTASQSAEPSSGQ